jgi:hypothetical protein
VESYYDRVLIVFIHDVSLYGTVDKLGAFASVVKYKQDGVDFEELLDNEDFSIMDEIVFEHIEEEN